MVTNPIPGNSYWTIRLVEECYERKHMPRRGVLQGTTRGAWYLCSVSDDGVVDEDSNASAFVGHADLYETREEALADYIPAQEAYIEWLGEKLQKANKALADAKLEIQQ